MSRLPFLIAVLLLSGAAAWGLHLAVDPDPFAPDSAAVLSISLVGYAIIAGTGLLLVRSRWTRWAALGPALVMVGLGAPTPLDPGAAMGVALGGAAAAGLTGPWIGTRLRRLPSAAGPSPAGAAAVLTALAVPGIVALARWTGLSVADWVLIGTTIIAAWGLARAEATGLWAMRVALPAAAVAALITDGIPSGLIVAAAAAPPAALAWRHELSLAVAPLVPQRRLPIPPELTPPDVLRSARYDERGRPVGDET